MVGPFSIDFICWLSRVHAEESSPLHALALATTGSMNAVFATVNAALSSLILSARFRLIASYSLIVSW